MNLLSRRSVLAIAAVVDIALHSRPSPVAAKALAARHKLPPRHLETLLQGLVHAKILKGVRGPRGGYELARERRRITIGEIVRTAVSLSTADPEDIGAHSKLLEKVIEPACARRASRSWPSSTPSRSRISAKSPKRRMSSRKRKPAPISRSRSLARNSISDLVMVIIAERAPTSAAAHGRRGMDHDGSPRRAKARAAGASTSRSPTRSAIRRSCDSTSIAKEKGVAARPARQARVLQPDRQRQGPHRRRDDRRARGAGQDRARARRARRADLGQHRHRAGLRRRGARLQADPGHARIDVDRAAQDAGAARRRARADARAARHEGRDRQGQ